MTNPLVPTLRFPGFSGEWEAKKLSDLVQKITKSFNPTSSSQEYKVIELESLSQGTGELLKTFSSTQQKSMKTKFQTNDVLYGKLRPYLRKFYYADFDGVCTSEIWVLREKELKSNYLYQLVQSSKFSEAVDIQAGSKMPRADWETVANTVFVTPPNRNEQKKIAGFLTVVDERVAASQKKVELLQQYKKGVMQKIFTQKIRFKDENGNGYPAWQEKKLGEVFRERTGRGGTLENMLSVTIKGGVVPFSMIDRKDNSSESKHNYKKVEAGDIAYNSMRMWQGASGVSSYAGIVSPAYTVITPQKGHASHFWGYYFKLPRVIFTFQRFSQGLTSDTWNLKFKQLSEITLSTPEEGEQQKIADFLTSLDDKIKLEETKLEQAKQFKKSLLQRMFV